MSHLTSSRISLWVLALLCLLLSPPISPAQTTQPNPNLPTLWLVGDSTVRNGSGQGGQGQWGWGDRLAKHFDTSKINIVNRARGGRSSRSFINEGLWDALLKDAKKGDFVLIQMGHNDSGPLAGDNRERGTIRGTGDESQTVTLTLDPRKGQPETVHTYGWYLRKYITDARAHGLTPILCSPIPRRPKSPETNRPTTSPTGHPLWARQVAQSEKVPFLDLHTQVLTHYAKETPDALKQKYFTKADDTHTSQAGADLSAQAVVESLRTLPANPLAPYLR